MIKLTYLAFKAIWRQKWLNLFLIIAVVMSVYYLAPLLYQTVHYVSAVQALDDLDMQNGYYLYTNLFYDQSSTVLRDSIQKKADTLNLDIAEYITLEGQNIPYAVVVYNEILVSKFIPRMSEGEWLNAVSLGSHVPAIVPAELNMPCGEIFTLRLLIAEEEQQLECEVVGILKDTAGTVAFTGVADDEYFTTDILVNQEETAIILPMHEKISELISTEPHVLYSSGRILYSSDEISDVEMRANFGYVGVITDLDAGHNRLYEMAMNISLFSGAYFMIYLFIAVVSLFCSSFILNIKLKKIYTIYYLSGMSQADRKIIEIIRNILIIFLCGVFTFIFLQRTGIFQMFFRGISNIIIFLVIELYIGLVYIPFSVVFFLKDKDIEISDAVKNLDT